MICNTTYNNLIKHTAIVTATLASIIWMGSVSADEPTKTVAISNTEPTQAAGTVNTDNRFDLNAYGDRFQLAVKLIEQESKKSCWGWGACGKDDD